MPNYWLFKSEPNAYSWDDLVRDGVAEWDGVRNFQARNLLKDEIKAEDQVLFYHSSTNPQMIMGIAQVVRAGYPDHTAWDPQSDHPDPKSTPERPIWYMVDIKPVRPLPNPPTLASLRHVPGLAGMLLLKRGVRLSVQPVKPEEWQVILRLGGAEA